MSAFERALKRAQQETGTVPENMSGVASWLRDADGDDGAIPEGLLDRFTNEGPPRERREERRDAREAERPAPIMEPAAIPPPSFADELGEAAPEWRSEAAPAPAPPPPPAAAETVPDFAPEGRSHQAPPPLALFNGFSPKAAGKLVAEPDMDHATTEQYGRLAAVLHHAQQERGLKTVMVTSAMAGEGKTLTALNLALTLSESYGRRVALLDADLRCSRVHELLNVIRVTGLSEALQEDGGALQSRMLPITPRLSVLLAGCSNLDPKGALTSQRMSQVLAEAAAAFDWVIVDTPPVVLLPDTNLLARMVDGAIVVVRAGKTSYDVVERAVQTLDKKRVLGIVLNDAKEAEALQYYKYSTTRGQK
jgi:capsular exopolysaccharide synthesis family protein